MKAVQHEEGKYWGELHGQLYLIQDDQAEYFYEKGQLLPAEELVKVVMRNKALWEEDLTLLPNFAAVVTQNLTQLLEKGASHTLQSFLSKTVYV